MREDWSEFKSDVGLKSLISSLDKGIRRRERLIELEDEEENQKVQRFKQIYMKLKPLKQVALLLYLFLVILEKPGWCLHNANIDINTTQGYWYCNNESGDYVNSKLPKLPIWVTSSVYIICLVTLMGFLLARDVYRRLEDYGIKRAQVALSIIAILNLV